MAERKRRNPIAEARNRGKRGAQMSKGRSRGGSFDPIIRGLNGRGLNARGQAIVAQIRRDGPRVAAMAVPKAADVARAATGAGRTLDDLIREVQKTINSKPVQRTIEKKRFEMGQRRYASTNRPDPKVGPVRGAIRGTGRAAKANQQGLTQTGAGESVSTLKSNVQALNRARVAAGQRPIDYPGRRGILGHRTPAILGPAHAGKFRPAVRLDPSQVRDMRGQKAKARPASHPQMRAQPAARAVLRANANAAFKRVTPPQAKAPRTSAPNPLRRRTSTRSGGRIQPV